MNISAVVNTCVDIINRQHVKDIYTYSKYGSTSSLLLSTYQASYSKVLSLMYCTRSLPIRRTPCMKTSVSPSVGPSNSGSSSTSSSMYEEQNVKTSLSMYALAIDPSGLALFLKRFFNVPSRRSIGYIQPYYTGPLSSASSGRWSAKCSIRSKKAGGKILSSLHRISGISCFRRWTTCTERFLLHSSRKKFPSSATTSYRSGRTSPLKPAGMILCKRTWQEWVFIRPWTFEPSAVM